MRTCNSQRLDAFCGVDDEQILRPKNALVAKISNSFFEGQNWLGRFTFIKIIIDEDFVPLGFSEWAKRRTRAALRRRLDEHFASEASAGQDFAQLQRLSFAVRRESVVAEISSGVSHKHERGFDSFAQVLVGTRA